MTLTFSTKEGVAYVLNWHAVSSHNELAKLLSGDGLTIQRGQIKNYLTGTQMTKIVALRFLILFDIVIVFYESKNRKFKR